MAMSTNQTTYVLICGIAIAAGLAIWLSLPPKKQPSPADEKDDSKPAGITPTKSNVRSSASSRSTATTSAPTNEDSEKALHREIEEIDRQGKSLFKDKNYTAAADCFTRALDLIDGHGGNSGSLTRQVVTLTNNRSAMYEKASLPDLALSDCDAVLLIEPSHTKARTRRLRILESLSRFSEAIVEVCALQIKYMHDNRDKIRLGLPPSGSPPVSQSKIEELVLKILPGEMMRCEQATKDKKLEDRALPSTYTIVQLLKSFSGYNKWMGEAARDGTVDKFTTLLENMKETDASNAENIAAKATLFYQRGKRFAFEKKFYDAVNDFDQAYDLAHNGVIGQHDNNEMKSLICQALGNDVYARILEWGGMCRHLRYDLEGALECYERCSEMEPDNTEVIVKRAGVKMDGSNHSDAEKLFAEALKLNPSACDALLHRANLRMLQQRVADAESDLQTCIRLYPNNLLARLRLATVLMAKEDMNGATRMLDQAAEYDPESSEVHCYRGELHFAKGELDDAKTEFKKAMKCDESNPTPYVNSALAIMNTPPSGTAMVPDFGEAVSLLEKAVEVDPMFHSAYVQLGQIKLSIATDLTKAREVVELYDRGLEYCRTPEELKDICSMRILTMAQIDAAEALRMETLNMQ